MFNFASAYICETLFRVNPRPRKSQGGSIKILGGIKMGLLGKHGPKILRVSFSRAHRSLRCSWPTEVFGSVFVEGLGLVWAGFQASVGSNVDFAFVPLSACPTKVCLVPRSNDVTGNVNN